MRKSLKVSRVANDDMSISLIEGDALETLPKLPGESFELVLLDPPYLIGRIPKVRTRHLLAMDGGGMEWGFLLKELHRVMRPDSTLLLFGHVSFLVRITPHAEAAGFRYFTDVVWVKPGVVNFLKAKEKPLSKHELITVWAKGRLRYNWEGGIERGNPYGPRVAGRDTFYEIERTPKGNPGFRYMADVIFAPNKPCMPKEERTPHPTQKPLALVRKLVGAFSFPGDSVLDPFAGSGTTLVACKELGRRCVGIEIDPEYADLIRRRVAREAEGLDPEGGRIVSQVEITRWIEGYADRCRDCMYSYGVGAGEVVCTVRGERVPSDTPACQEFRRAL